MTLIKDMTQHLNWELFSPAEKIIWLHDNTDQTITDIARNLGLPLERVKQLLNNMLHAR